MRGFALGERMKRGGRGAIRYELTTVRPLPGSILANHKPEWRPKARRKLARERAAVATVCLTLTSSIRS